MQQMIDIFLVNGDRLFRESLGALMASWPGYELAGEAATVSEARAALVRHQVDVVLVDIDLPGESGFPLLQHLTRDHHGVLSTLRGRLNVVRRGHRRQPSVAPNVPRSDRPSRAFTEG
jgi:DNA-binding NarL/FixJ family response regulator